MMSSSSARRLMALSARRRGRSNFSIQRSAMSQSGTGLRECSFSRPRRMVVTRLAASRLATTGRAAADGWPPEDPADGLAMAVKTGHPPGWLVAVGGTVIGDIGTPGPVDEAGRGEIGYGLAAPSRGRGYGSEAVAA